MLLDKNEIIEDDIIEDEVIEDADMVLLSIMYDGKETDNIIVNVNNKERTISATLKQIQYGTQQDFPEQGSDKLIYVAKDEDNSLYRWDSTLSDYVKIGENYGNEIKDLQDKKLDEFLVNGEKSVEGTTAKITISLDKDPSNDLTYNLKVNDKTVGTINIPKDQFIKTITYDKETNHLNIVWETASGEQTTSIDLNDLMDVYKAGNGLELDANNTFKIKIDPASSTNLSVSENGLSLNIDDKLPTFITFDSQITYDKNQILKAADFDTIAKVETLGKAQEVFAVGDETTFNLTTGEAVTVQIVGFEHDDLAGGSGKAYITWGLKNALRTEYRMNETDTNVGGWTSCQMRTITLPAIYELLPENVKRNIKLVKKKTSEGNGSSNIVETEDKLFLFSAEEVFGIHKNNVESTYIFYLYTFPGEGTQYDFFKNAPIPIPLSGTGKFTALIGDSGTFYTPDKTIADGFVDLLNMNETLNVNEYYNYYAQKGRYYNYKINPTIYWLRSPCYQDKFVKDNTGFAEVNYSTISCNGSYTEWALVFGFCT